MAQVHRLVGLRAIWDVNLQNVVSVRTLAHAGQLERLEVLLRSARVHAGRAGLTDAARLLAVKLDEVAALKVEVAALAVPVADVIVLDDDWGKRGRGAKITAWILAHGADADAVMERFQLARSTAQRYVRQARKAMPVQMAA